MKLRSQQRGKPSPNFSLEKIKKKKQRRVNTAAVKQAIAAVLAATSAPVPVQVPTPAALQLPVWQPRVVLRDILKSNTSPQEVEEVQSSTCNDDVPRRVQKRKTDNDGGPSTKRRRVEEEKKRKQKKMKRGPTDATRLRRSARIAARSQPESMCPAPEPEVQPAEAENEQEAVLQVEDRVQDIDERIEEQLDEEEEFGEPEEEIVDEEEWWWLSEEEADVEIQNITEYLSEESIPCDALGCDYVSWTLEGYRTHILVVHGIETHTGQGELRAQPIEYEEEEETQQQLTEEEQEEREFRRWQEGFRRVQRRIKKELREERRARREEN